MIQTSNSGSTGSTPRAPGPCTRGWRSSRRRLVERSDEGRKAVYRITDAGREEVRQRADDLANLESDLDHSVRELAEQVRFRVSTQTSDLRSELREAARQARSTATVGASDLAQLVPGVRQEVESAVAELREEARRAWRQYGLTSEQGARSSRSSPRHPGRSRTWCATAERAASDPDDDRAGGLVVQAAPVLVPEHRRQEQAEQHGAHEHLEGLAAPPDSERTCSPTIRCPMV